MTQEYLVKAKALGDTNASKDLDELLEYGDKYRCPDLGFSAEFLKHFIR